jgi:hypothetical protein
MPENQQNGGQEPGQPLPRGLPFLRQVGAQVEYYRRNEESASPAPAPTESQAPAPPPVPSGVPSAASAAGIAPDQNQGERPSTRTNARESIEMDPFGPDEVQAHLRSLNIGYLEEEARFDDTKRELEERYRALDVLVEDGKQQDLALPMNYLGALMDAFGTIKDNYEKLCKNYIAYEKGNMNIHQYSAFLDDYMTEYAERANELYRMHESFAEAEGRQTSLEKGQVCGKIRNTVFELNQKLDEYRLGLDVYLFKWAAILDNTFNSVTKEQSSARAKIKEAYPEFIKDAPSASHPGWFKRALERKTYTVYSGEGSIVVNNENILRLMRNAATEFGVKYRSNDMDKFDREARSLDREVRNAVVVDSIDKHERYVRRAIEGMQLEEIRKLQLTQELEVVRQNTAVLEDRLKRAEKGAEDNKDAADELETRLRNTQTYGLIGSAVAAFLTFVAGALVVKYLGAPKELEELRESRRTAVVAQQDAESQRDEIRAELERARAQLQQYENEGVNLEELARLEEVAAQRDRALEDVQRLTTERDNLTAELGRYEGFTPEDLARTGEIVAQRNEARADVTRLQGELNTATEAAENAERTRNEAVARAGNAEGERDAARIELEVYTNIGTPQDVRALLAERDPTGLLARARRALRAYQRHGSPEEVEEAMTRYNAVEEERDTTNAEATRLRTEVQGLRTQLEQAQAAQPAGVAVLQRQLDELNQRNSELTERMRVYDDAVRERATAEGVQIDVISPEMGILAQRVIAAQTEAENLREQLAQAQAQGTGADPEEVARLRRQLEQAQNSNVRYEARIRDLEARAGTPSTSTQPQPNAEQAAPQTAGQAARPATIQPGRQPVIDERNLSDEDWQFIDGL